MNILKLTAVTVTAVFMAMGVVLNPAAVVNEGSLFGAAAHAGEAVSDKSRPNPDYVVREMEHEKKWLSFARRMRYLVDLLRVQKKVFLEQKGNVRNEVAFRGEELVSDANWDAGRGKFDDGYTKLDTAEAELEASLREMGVTEIPLYKPAGSGKSE